MTTEQATLIAATLAATASILQIIISAASSRNTEFRAAHRRILEPYIENLGDSIHQILASSKTYLKKYNNGESLDSWRKRAEDALHKLKDIRRKVRYPLWGIDEGLRTITRLFHWVSHLQDYPELAQELFEVGNNLRKSLDTAIRNSYREGRPPITIEIWIINFWVWRLRLKRIEIFKQIKDADPKGKILITDED